MTEPRFSGIFSVAMGSAASVELKAPVAITAHALDSTGWIFYSQQVAETVLPRAQVGCWSIWGVLPHLWA